MFNRSYIFVGHTSEALKSYKTAYTVDPDHYLFMVNAARLLQNMHKTSQASKLFDRSVDNIECNHTTYLFQFA